MKAQVALVVCDECVVKALVASVNLNKLYMGGYIWR